MLPFLWKCNQTLQNSGQWKRRKSVIIRPKFGISRPAYGQQTWPYDHLPNDKNAQDCDDSTPYPVMSLVCVLKQLGTSHMVATHGENSEHTKGKPRSRFNPNHNSQGRPIISEDRKTTTIRNLEHPSSHVTLGTTNRNKDSKTSLRQCRLFARRPSRKPLLTQR